MNTKSWMALPLVFVLAGVAHAGSISIFSTGQNVLDGLDESFEIISDTTGEIVAPAQAFVVTSLPGAWHAPIAGTEWIGPTANQSVGCTCPDSADTYQTTFSLAGFDPATASLDFTMLVDNDITVVLNGVTVYSNGNPDSDLFSTPFSFDVDSGFVAGTNTMQFIVGNAYGPTGIDASITGTATPIGSSVPEPSTAALCACGLAAVAMLRRRRA
jgi:hypothetical protein